MSGASVEGTHWQWMTWRTEREGTQVEGTAGVKRGAAARGFPVARSRRTLWAAQRQRQQWWSAHGLRMVGLWRVRSSDVGVSGGSRGGKGAAVSVEHVQVVPEQVSMTENAMPLGVTVMEACLLASLLEYQAQY